MDYETLRCEIADGVAVIRLDRPDAGNALSPRMASDLNRVSLAIEGNRTVRAVVLTGTGRMFCAGGDLRAIADAGNGARSMILQTTGDLHLAISRLSRNPAPVIGAINGIAAGAGLSLVMMCDLAVAARSAIFTSAYTNAGLAPDGSSTFFMPRKIGDRRARELMLTNRVLKADEALDWGVVNQVVDDDQVVPEGLALARKLATGPTAAYGQVKALLNATFDNGLETQMELESRAVADMIDTADGSEGVLAFLEKRKPTFKGV